MDGCLVVCQQIMSRLDAFGRELRGEEIQIHSKGDLRGDLRGTDRGDLRGTDRGDHRDHRGDHRRPPYYNGNWTHTHINSLISFAERDFSPDRNQFHSYNHSYNHSHSHEYNHRQTQPHQSDHQNFGSKSEEFLLDIREYAAQHRDSAASKTLDDLEIARRYEVYRKSFIHTMNEKYFKIHCTEEWYVRAVCITRHYIMDSSWTLEIILYSHEDRFREKYHPKENVAFTSQVRARKADCLADFDAELAKGTWNAIDLNEPLDAVEGVHSFGLDLGANETSKPHTLFITGVPLEVKRADLLKVSQSINQSNSIIDVVAMRADSGIQVLGIKRTSARKEPRTGRLDHLLPRHKHDSRPRLNQRQKGTSNQLNCL